MEPQHLGFIQWSCNECVNHEKLCKYNAENGRFDNNWRTSKPLLKCLKGADLENKGS